jgi:hypothetical protein
METEHMQYLSVEETLSLIAKLVEKNGESRGRISNKSICKISRRPRLRAKFIHDLIVNANDYGLCMGELDAGGFGFIKTAALEGARIIGADLGMD